MKFIQFLLSVGDLTFVPLFVENLPYLMSTLAIAPAVLTRNRGTNSKV